jgi:spore coat protein U-like protein
MRLRPAFLGLALAPLAAGEAAAFCNIDLTPVNFGTIDVMRRNDSTGKVTVTCDQPATFLVGIGPSASGNGREMQGPDDAKLRYELYIDPGYSVPWGDGQSIGQMNGGSSNGSKPETLTVYGRVPAQSGALPGSYSDALLVTLLF